MKRALQVIVVLALSGMSSSGVLAYRDFFGVMGGCPSSGKAGTVGGYPLSIYAFFFALSIAIIASVGLWAGAQEMHTRPSEAHA